MNQRAFDKEKAALLTMIRKRQEQYTKLQDSVDGIGKERPSIQSQRFLPVQMLDEGTDLLKVAHVPSDTDGRSAAHMGQESFKLAKSIQETSQKVPAMNETS